MITVCAKVLDSKGNLFKYEIYNGDTDQIALVCPFEVDSLFHQGQLTNVSNSRNRGTDLKFYGLSTTTFPIFNERSEYIRQLMILKIYTNKGVQLGVKVLMPWGYYKDVTIGSLERWLIKNNCSLYNATIKENAVQAKVQNTIATVDIG